MDDCTARGYDRWAHDDGDGEPPPIRRLGDAKAGGTARQKRLSEELHLGPEALKGALNLLAAARYTRRGDDVPGLGREVLEILAGHAPLVVTVNVPVPAEVSDGLTWLPLVQAVETIRDAVDAMREANDPRASEALLVVELFTASMVIMNRDFRRKGLVVAADNCNRARRLVESFWYLPDRWLRRLKRCRATGCETPYFLDHSARLGRLDCDRHQKA